MCRRRPSAEGRLFELAYVGKFPAVFALILRILVRDGCAGQSSPTAEEHSILLQCAAFDVCGLRMFFAPLKEGVLCPRHR